MVGVMDGAMYRSMGGAMNGVIDQVMYGAIDQAMNVAINGRGHRYFKVHLMDLS